MSTVKIQTEVNLCWISRLSPAANKQPNEMQPGQQTNRRQLTDISTSQSIIWRQLKNITFSLQPRVTFPKFRKRFSLMTATSVTICTTGIHLYVTNSKNAYKMYQCISNLES